MELFASAFLLKTVLYQLLALLTLLAMHLPSWQAGIITMHHSGFNSK
jgi:hypothetical protein